MQTFKTEKRTEGQTCGKAKAVQDSAGQKHDRGRDLVGSGYHPPERFVPLLAKFSHSPNAVQRAQLLNQLQQRYGNHYVQRVVSAYRAQKDEKEEEKLASEILARKGSGRQLEPELRRFFESRFGYDFSHVRIHTDTYAARKSNELTAEAFTIGNDIFFNSGRYNPVSMEGKRLLAHELTHVLQQRDLMERWGRMSHPSDSLETEAEAIADSIATGRSTSAAPKKTEKSRSRIFRRVASRLVNCTGGTHGAPANPINALNRLDTMAGGYATLVSVLLALESAFVRAGLRNPASRIQQAYQNRFGLPPARPGGFLNRLTGNVRATQDQAISEELGLLSRRFEIIARMFSQFIHYRCIGGASTFAGCAPPHCNAFAWSCGGIGAIFLCPLFWTGITDQQQAGILIHEAAHINWTQIRHGVTGPGGNFRHAECYASFITDVIGFASPVAPCPAPPP